VRTYGNVCYNCTSFEMRMSVFERRKVGQVRPDRHSRKVCIMEYPTDMVRCGQFAQQDAKYQNKVITKHVALYVGNIMDRYWIRQCEMAGS
jgi:hypothetical protein